MALPLRQGRQVERRQSRCATRTGHAQDLVLLDKLVLSRGEFLDEFEHLIPYLSPVLGGDVLWCQSTTKSEQKRELKKSRRQRRWSHRERSAFLRDVDQLPVCPIEVEEARSGDLDSVVQEHTETNIRELKARRHLRAA